LLTSEIVKEFSEPEKAWLACAIDSEGSINLRQDSRHPNTMNMSVWFCNTSVEFARRFEYLTGGTLYTRPPRGFGKKQQYEVYVTSKTNVKRILESVLPYLIVKRDKAAQVLDWIHMHPLTREDRIVRLNRTLPRNTRGFNTKA
jgi:hypothetical protein